MSWWQVVLAEQQGSLTHVLTRNKGVPRSAGLQHSFTSC
jgi:hypothetical protein